MTSTWDFTHRITKHKAARLAYLYVYPQGHLPLPECGCSRCSRPLTTCFICSTLCDRSYTFYPGRDPYPLCHNCYERIHTDD